MSNDLTKSILCIFPGRPSMNLDDTYSSSVERVATVGSSDVAGKYRLCNISMVDLLAKVFIARITWAKSGLTR